MIQSSNIIEFTFPVDSWGLPDLEKKPQDITSPRCWRVDLVLTSAHAGGYLQSQGRQGKPAQKRQEEGDGGTPEGPHVRILLLAQGHLWKTTGRFANLYGRPKE